jgi:hypothetical protein
LTGFEERSDDSPKRFVHPWAALLFWRLEDNSRWSGCCTPPKRRLDPLGCSFISWWAGLRFRDSDAIKGMAG